MKHREYNTYSEKDGWKDRVSREDGVAWGKRGQARQCKSDRGLVWEFRESQLGYG